MAEESQIIDLARQPLRAGEGRRFEHTVRLEPLMLGGESYRPTPEPLTVVVDVARMIGGGISLRLRCAATLNGICMRCLAAAAPTITIDTYEVDVPGEGPELDSPYIDCERVQLGRWVHDTLVLALPRQILCREDCRGLCAICGADLNADPEHRHERAPDRRWAKLSELTFDTSEDDER